MNTTLVLPGANRGLGVCAMRGGCGRKSPFDPELPCVDDGAADETTPEIHDLLTNVCGPAFDIPSRLCCTQDQVEALRDNLLQAEPLIASCPACRNNFRSFYCHFTCSPSQSQFLSVVSTQPVGRGDAAQTAVKEIDVFVADSFKTAFFDACKDVQFGATNSYSMDLLGGGATDGQAFLSYMGKERPGLGSPFQINFPPESALPDGQGFEPLAPTPLRCDDSARLDSRCTCADCPSVCPSLPYLPPPPPAHPEPTCHVGRISCGSFTVILVYAVGVVALFAAYVLQAGLRAKARRGGDRAGGVALLLDDDDEGEAAPMSPTGLSSAAHPPPPGTYFGALPPSSSSSASAAPPNGAHGGRSSSQHSTANGAGGPGGGYPASGRSGESVGLVGRGASLLDPTEQLQPRRSRVNVVLKKAFYRLGLFCAGKPFLTLAIASLVVGLLNLGWKRFDVETDPVRLWVAPGSEVANQKAHFDDSFGPFFRPQQIFITASPAARVVGDDSDSEAADEGSELRLPTPSEPALSFDRLTWWLEREAEIRALKSEPNGYTLEDVCFAPAGEGTPCVVQSVSAWFGPWGVDEDSWRATVDQCAASPAECLPDFGQPLEPKFVLGGGAVPGGDGVEPGQGRWSDAESFIVTFVLTGQKEGGAALARAEEWERALRAYLADVQKTARADGQAWVAFSTGVSLEEELGRSGNTDVRTIVASYVLMFLYVSLTLGGGGASGSALLFGPDGVIPVLWDKVLHVLVLLRLASAPPGPGRSSSRAITSPSRRLRSRLLRLLTLLPTLVSVNSKFTLGLFGIAVVLVAVSSSVGLFSLLGVKVTLIIAEVIPFLVLAVGVDNVFILVHELDRQNALYGPQASSATSSSSAAAAAAARARGQLASADSYEDDLLQDDEDVEMPPASHLPVDERVARALSRMGPSILLSSATETLAFALGALVPMPAVRNFALYAAGSVLLDALLQVTVFVSAMALDLKRVEATRMDCFPCVRLQPPVGLYDSPAAAAASDEGMITRFVRRHYAPFLLRREVKAAVLAAFAGLLILAGMGVQKIDLGLDQRLALPSDSYLAPYFDAVDKYLQVGPPVYFVTDHLDVTARAGQQALCGRFTTCQELSVASTLDAERKRPDVSYLANPPAVWIDDFLAWLNPVLESCCRVRIADPDTFCAPDEPARRCQPCFLDRDPPFDITMAGLPEGDEFMRFVRQWLASPTSEDCPLAGRSSYGTALALAADNSSVVASHFRTFHTPLKTQDDFINALAAADRIAADLTARTGARVYPYSLFYVFFDQYAHVSAILVEVLVLALGAVMLVTTLLLGSWRTAALVTTTCALVVFNVMGVMGFWGIRLNAISLVNLVISLGIAVEFTAHVARAFLGANGGGLPVDHPVAAKDRDERAWAALVDVGSSVFSGITMTKLIGVTVLAFTRSKLLEVYFFRMWLTLIVAGALHGLVLLPVLLSLFGDQGFEYWEDADESWMGAAARVDFAPFRDDESLGSDD